MQSIFEQLELTRAIRPMCESQDSLADHPAVQSTKVAIEWPSTGKRAREVVRRSNYRVTYKYPSIRNGCTVHAESKDELECFIRLDADPAVISFREQPALIRFVHGGIERKHFPDVLVHTDYGKGFLEIKPAGSPDLAFAIQRAAVLRPALLELGYGYEVVTSDQITAEPYLTNARLLLSRGRENVSTAERESMTTRLAETGAMTWRQISTGAWGTKGLAIASHLILDGHIHFDRSRLLDANTRIAVTATMA